MKNDVATRLARVVKAYDVRGLVDEDLDPALMRRLGAAAVAVLLGTDGGRLVVGRDMRLSSMGLAEALAEGARSAGADVIDIGLASTDQVYFASGTLDAVGAMVTASHNPAAYNGVKLCRPGAAPVAWDTGLAAIGDLAASSHDLSVAAAGRRTTRDIGGEFRAHAHGFVDVEWLAGIRVVVDAGNGMAGHVWPQIADGTGIETIPLYFDLDGTFPNHPADPLDPANLTDLAATVRRERADLGLAFDGDGDRVFAVDASGAPLDASVTGAIIASHLLSHAPKATKVLHNLICSRIVPETISAHGGVPVRTRVGHSFIKRDMARTDALLGIEHSGHYYFRDNFRADSGVIAALILLEAVARADRRVASLTAGLARYVRSGEINHRVTDPPAALDRVALAFEGRGSIDRLDGVSVSMAAGWFNLRPSNTEPLVRFNAEAVDGAELQRLVDEVAALVDPGRSSSPRTTEA